MEVKPHAFFTSALFGSEWSALCSGFFIPRVNIQVSKWAPESVLTRWGRELQGIEFPPVAGQFND